MGVLKSLLGESVEFRQKSWAFKENCLSSGFADRRWVLGSLKQGSERAFKLKLPKRDFYRLVGLIRDRQIFIHPT